MFPNTTDGNVAPLGSAWTPRVGTTISSLQHFDASSDLEVDGLMGGGGASSDVFKAQLHSGAVRGRLHYCVTSGCKTVAVKRFRTFVDRDRDFKVSIEREARIWSVLWHPNVLPLLGYMTLDGLPSLVSEWMDHGTLSQYWKSHPEANAFYTAWAIADGLSYLHEKGVVHSDLKCDNILVLFNGRPLLCDFGISRLLVDSMTITGTAHLKGSTRWMAVELIEPDPNVVVEHSLHTKASDVWACGMVLYELISGKLPYHHLHTDASIMRAITSNDHWYPLKPSKEEWWDGDSSWLWDAICVRCWAKSPDERPTMMELFKELTYSQMRKLLREYAIA